MVTEANTGGCNGWGRSVQGHESTELDAEMTGGKVASLMVGPFTAMKNLCCW